MKSWLGWILMVGLALAVFGCEDNGDPFGDDDDGSSDGDSDGDADGDGDADSDGDADGDGDSDCEEELQLIYVVDQDNMFYSFDPLASPDTAFQQVGSGPLTCASGGQPFSMSVGRDGYAYVLFVEGVLGYSCVAVNKVDIHTGVCEEAIPFLCGTAGFNTFGMGYVTDSASTTDETLYIGNSDSPASLGTLDVTNGDVMTIGPMASAGPEFTGNSLGELWGFFPQAATPTVAQIDKGDATVVDDNYWQLTGLSNDANAWAFAFWGGSFYIFYKTFSDASTNVYKLTDGTLTTHISNSGKYIVGAGVSTCAPVVIE